MDAMTFTVAGVPATKGSYRIVGGRKHGRLVADNAREMPWRRTVANQVRAQWWRTHPNARMPRRAGACEIDAVWRLQRPRTVRRGHPSVKPDLDKLARALFDALTDSGLIDDDARIIRATLAKTYCASARDQGVRFTIRWFDDEPTGKTRREEP